MHGYVMSIYHQRDADIRYRASKLEKGAGEMKRTEKLQNNTRRSTAGKRQMRGSFGRRVWRKNEKKLHDILHAGERVRHKM